MFKNIFSFDGRIRRLEYGISLIVFFILYFFILVFTGVFHENKGILIAFVPMLWFLWAQGAKRCHDVGKNGWWQIIPFYFLWLLFQDGVPYENEYGQNPKNARIYDETDYVSPLGTDDYYETDTTIVDPAVVLMALDDVAQVASNNNNYTDTSNDNLSTDSADSTSYDSNDSGSYDSDDSSSNDSDDGMDTF